MVVPAASSLEMVVQEAGCVTYVYLESIVEYAYFISIDAFVLGFHII
jgi:hypothetical protein